MKYPGKILKPTVMNNNKQMNRISQRYYPIVIALIITAIVPAMTPLQARPDGGDWQNYRGNARLTGITGYSIPSEPSTLWTFDAGFDIKSSPVIHNSLIIIGSGNGIVYCLSMDGELMWQFDTGNTIEGPALIHNNRVYIGNLGGKVFCLDLDNGNMIWEYECDNQVSAAPNIWSDGTRDILLVGSYDYYLHAINAETGSFIWKYELYNYLHSAVAIENDLAVFGGCDGYLHRVDLRRGDGLPEIEIASYVAGSPALEDGIAYIGDYDGTFTTVNYLSGVILWRWTDEERQLPFVASPAIHGNRIIIGNRDRFVYSLDKKTGEVQWRTNTGSRVESSAVTDGRQVIVANMRGDIMLLDINTGRRQWMFETGSAISGSPAISGNRIVLGTNDGTVWCFGN